MKLEEKQSLIESNLDSYTKQLGLEITSCDITSLLALKKEDLHKMSPLECGESAFLLQREATFIQLQVNRLQAKNNWAQTTIAHMIADKLASYGQYTPYDQRRILAIQENEVAKKLQQNIVENQLKIDSMQYISSYIRELQKNLIELAHIKENQK